MPRLQLHSALCLACLPAGESQHVETWIEDLQIPSGVDVRLFGVFSHMHLAGTDIKISIEREGEEVCLSHNPRPRITTCSCK